MNRDSGFQPLAEGGQEWVPDSDDNGLVDLSDTDPFGTPVPQSQLQPRVPSPEAEAWADQFVAGVLGGDESPAAASAPVAPANAKAPVRLVKPQRLLEDPQGLYANPHTIDWASGPITAMKLTIEYTEQTLREVPGMVKGVVDQALTDAAKLNEDSGSKLIGAFRTVFFSEKQLRSGFKGIVLELDARTSKMGASLTSFGQLLGKQVAANTQMDGLVETLSARLVALEEIVGKREAAVAQRENKVGQREVTFKRKADEFAARGFWGHIGTAFMSLSKSHAGAGFGIVVLIGVMVLAGRGVMAMVH